MPNSTVNKVEYGGQTIIDITDTTADAADVIEGEVFYAKSGARSVGTLTDATQSTHGLMSTSDKIKLDGINLLGIKLSTTALTPDSNGIVTIPLMTGATSSTDGTAGLIPAPTSADAEKFFRGDGTWQDGGRPMVILSYGNSTWDNFITAYNNNVIVYCRASSNSNPASGSQTRMAFMAYINNATTPTEVEFQYYRSMSSHSATAMGDQVFVYKLNKTNGWSVTTRDTSIKEINVASGSKLGVSWSGNKVTLSNTMTADDMPMSSSDATTTKSAIDTLNTKLNTDANLTYNILSDAINVTGTKFFKASGGDYTGTVPADVFKYGYFLVFKRNAMIFVLASCENRIALNKYENNSWRGWTEFRAVKTVTETGNTDTGGNRNLATSYMNVIEAHAVGYICVPFQYNGRTYLKVLNYSDLSPVASTSVTYSYTYITD